MSQSEETERSLEFSTRMQALIMEFYDFIGPAEEALEGREYAEAPKVPDCFPLDWVILVNWSMPDNKESGTLECSPGMRYSALLGTLYHWLRSESG